MTNQDNYEFNQLSASEFMTLQYLRKKGGKLRKSCIDMSYELGLSDKTIYKCLCNLAFMKVVKIEGISYRTYIVQDFKEWRQ